jgi:hypothetical protein
MKTLPITRRSITKQSKEKPCLLPGDLSPNNPKKSLAYDPVSYHQTIQRKALPITR